MHVKISYLFSRNTKKIGSRIISKVSGLLLPDMDKVPSHMAILIEFSDTTKPLVLESVFGQGVRLVPYANWKNLNEELYIVLCKKNHTYNEISNLIINYWGKSYDWLGIMYFSWRFILHFLFKTPFPLQNAWQSNNRYFCNELGGILADYKNHSMTTPAKMCWDLLNNQNT